MMQLLHSAQNNSLTTLFIFLAISLISRELLFGQLRKRIFLYYVFLFPGVVIHELAHTLGCLVTGARIHKITFFSKTGGMVVHEGGRFGIVGNFIISIFPFVIGVLILVNILHFFTSETTFQQAILSYAFISVFISMFPSFQDIKNASSAYFAVLIALIALAIVYGKLLVLPDTSIYLMGLCLTLLIVVNLALAVFNLVFSRHK